MPIIFFQDSDSGDSYIYMVSSAENTDSEDQYDDKDANMFVDVKASSLKSDSVIGLSSDDSSDWAIWIY